MTHDIDMTFLSIRHVVLCPNVKLFKLLVGSSVYFLEPTATQNFESKTLHGNVKHTGWENLRFFSTEIAICP